MAESFLESLGRNARLAYPIIERGVREGLSSRSLTALLNEHGIGLRRQTLLDVMRRVGDIQLKGSQLRYLNPTFTPNPARLGEAVTKIRRAFSFTVEIRGTLVSSGDRWTQHVTVSTSQLLTREKIEAIALEAVEKGHERYDMEIEEVILIGGIRAGALGTF